MDLNERMAIDVAVVGHCRGAMQTVGATCAQDAFYDVIQGGFLTVGLPDLGSVVFCWGLAWVGWRCAVGEDESVSIQQRLILLLDHCRTLSRPNEHLCTPSPGSTQQAPSKHPLGNSRRRSSKHMAHGVLCRQPAGRGLLRPWPFIRDPSDASGSFPCHGVLASAPRATAASTAPAHFTTPSPSTPPLRNNAVQRDEVQSRIRAAPSWGVASVAKALCA